MLNICPESQELQIWRQKIETENSQTQFLCVWTTLDDKFFTMAERDQQYFIIKIFVGTQQ